MLRTLRVILAITALLMFWVLYKAQSNRSKLNEEFAFYASLPKTIVLKSEGFAYGYKIPLEYTGQGGNVSPQLSWDTVPPGTRSLAIMVTDYDAPSPQLKLMIINHWALYNIPHGIKSLPKGITKAQLDSINITVAQNYAGTESYAGPKPIFGEHQYYYRVFALDFNSLFLKTPNREELLKALKGHVLAYGELVAKF
jgi:Raf kinase inhibitor-like YbhB/YbcL family protein